MPRSVQLVDSAIVREFRWFAAIVLGVAGLLVGLLPGQGQVLLVSAVAGVGMITVLPSWALLAITVVTFRSLPDPVVGDLTITDVFMLAWLIRMYGRVMIRKYPIRLRRPVRSLAAYFLVAWGMTLLAGVSVTPLLRMTLYAAVAVTLATMTTEKRRPVFGVLVTYAVVEVVISLPQLSTRMAGLTVGDPQQLGILLLAALAVVRLRGVALRLTARRWVLSILWLGIVATRTRGVWLAAIMFLVIVGVRRITRRRIVLVTAALLAVAWLLYGPVTSALDLNPTSRDYRVESVTAGIRVGMDHWATGVGWGGLSPSEAEARLAEEDQTRLIEGPLSVPYNVPVLIFAYTGVFGLALFIRFLWHAFGAIGRAQDAPVLAFLSTFIAISMIEPTFYAGSLATFLFFLFCGFGLRGQNVVHRYARVTPLAAAPGRSR